MVEFSLDNAYKKDIDNITRKLSKLGDKITAKSIIEQLALKIKDRIYLRTQAGYDVNYKKLAPYSPEYKKEKGKTIVNLTDTGGMLNSMIQKVMRNDTAKIFFSNDRARKLAKKHIEGERTKVRNFFGVNANDRGLAQKTYQVEIAKAIESVQL